MSRFRGNDMNAGTSSNAEAQMLVALQNAYGKLELKEKPHTDKEITVKVAKPDFWFEEAKLAVFLDGPHHLKLKQEQWDIQLDRDLEKQGITVLRLPYSPPLSKTNQGLFLAAIKAAVNR